MRIPFWEHWHRILCSKVWKVLQLNPRPRSCTSGKYSPTRKVLSCGHDLSQTEEGKQPYEPMFWLLCAPREGRLSWPHEVPHALSTPFPTAFQPPESAGGDELVLKAPKSGWALVHPLCLPTTASQEEGCSQLGSVTGTRESLEAKKIGSDFCAGMGDSLEWLGMCQPLNDSTLFSQLLSHRPPLRELQLPRSTALPCGCCSTHA